MLSSGRDFAQREQRARASAPPNGWLAMMMAPVDFGRDSMASGTPFESTRISRISRVLPKMSWVSARAASVASWRMVVMPRRFSRAFRRDFLQPSPASDGTDFFKYINSFMFSCSVTCLNIYVY